MAEYETKKTLRDLLRVVFRRRRLFILGATLFAVSVFIAAHFLPVRYTGTAIFERRSDVAATEAGAKGPESFETIKLTLTHELVGRNAVERVVRDLPVLTRGFPRDSQGQFTPAGQMARQRLIKNLQEGLKVTWKVRSPSVDLVSVSFTYRNPALAQQIPDLLVKNYMDSVLRRIEENLGASMEFLEKQVENCQDMLKQKRREKFDFETRHADMMPDSPGAVANRIGELSSDIDTLARQLKAAEQTRAQLKSLLNPTEASTTQPVDIVKGPNPKFKELQDELQRFKDQLDVERTLRHRTDKHPEVKTLLAKIKQLEEQLEQTEPETVLQKVYRKQEDKTGIRAELARVLSDIDTTTKELERKRNRLDRYEKLMANFAIVRREYEMILGKLEQTSKDLEIWQKKLRQVEMNLQAEVAKRRTHLRPVEKAQKQFRPSFPSMWMVFGFALIGGACFGGGLVFLAGHLDRSFATTEEAARYLNVPVHGVIGEIVTPVGRARRLAIKWGLGLCMYLIVLGTLAASGFSIYLWLDKPEEYKKWQSSPVGYVCDSIGEKSGRPAQTE